MLCGQNTHIFLKILEILLMLCEGCTEESAKIRGGDCNIPKDDPIVIMFMNCKSCFVGW
jgi:hypothetical protein